MKKAGTMEKKRRKDPERKARRREDPRSNVQLFRSIKKVLFGRPRKRSMDLLDRWILKKNPLGMFL